VRFSGASLRAASGYGETMNDAHASTAEVSSIVLDQADRLFRGEATKERLADADRGAWPTAIWDAIEQAGLPLAMVAEAHGGVGLTPTDALQVIRRAGYHTLPVPLAETMIAAALWTQAGGDAPHGTLSLGPTRAADSVALEPISDGYVLHGSAARIPWGANVDNVLLYAHTGSGTGHLVLLPRGTVATQARRNLAFEPRDTFVFTGTSVPKTAVRPAAMAGGLLPFGALIRAQQLVGAMERCLDHAIGYAMERKQFGRPIGKFQAIRHKFAEMATKTEAAKQFTYATAWRFGNGEYPVREITMAKLYASRIACEVADDCLQILGGYGYMKEYEIERAYRDVRLNRIGAGTDEIMLDVIGRSYGL